MNPAPKITNLHGICTSSPSRRSVACVIQIFVKGVGIAFRTSTVPPPSIESTTRMNMDLRNRVLSILDNTSLICDDVLLTFVVLEKPLILLNWSFRCSDRGNMTPWSELDRSSFHRYAILCPTVSVGWVAVTFGPTGVTSHELGEDVSKKRSNSRDISAYNSNRAFPYGLNTDICHLPGQVRTIDVIHQSCNSSYWRDDNKNSQTQHTPHGVLLSMWNS